MTVLKSLVRDRQHHAVVHVQLGSQALVARLLRVHQLLVKMEELVQLTDLVTFVLVQLVILELTVKLRLVRQLPVKMVEHVVLINPATSVLVQLDTLALIAR